VLPPPPVKRPLQARFFDTVPLESCTVPQLPVPMPVVKFSSLGFGLKPQQLARVVVVVTGAVVVVTIVVVVATGPVVVVVATGPVVVVVATGPVVVVVATGPVVVVVATGPVVVVVVGPGGQGFGEQLPGPASCPPWALHCAGVRSMQVSKAPPADDWTQHCVCVGVVVVVVAVGVVVVVVATGAVVVVVATGAVVVVVATAVVVVVEPETQGLCAQERAPRDVPPNALQWSGVFCPHSPWMQQATLNGGPCPCPWFAWAVAPVSTNATASIATSALRPKNPQSVFRMTASVCRGQDPLCVVARFLRVSMPDAILYDCKDRGRNPHTPAKQFTPLGEAAGHQPAEGCPRSPGATSALGA